MTYPTRDTIGPAAQKVYDKAFVEALALDLPLAECELRADMALMEWDQEIELPDPDPNEYARQARALPSF